MKLEKTTNYSMFVKNPEQRPIDERHAKRIGENMQHVGYLPSKPIQCYKKGAKLVVVDGHHRLAAAKSLGIPIFYVIESDRSQQTMAAENLLVKKWSGIDFVRLYAARGIQSYKTLLYYVDRGIPHNMAASMMINNSASSGNANTAIQNGTFKIKSTEQIEMVDSILQEFGNKCPAIRSKMFISAISKCILWNGFNYDLFVRRLRENAGMIEKTSNEEQMLTQIEAVYNYRSRQPVPLKFHVEEATKARNLANLKNNRA